MTQDVVNTMKRYAKTIYLTAEPIQKKDGKLTKISQRRRRHRRV